MFFEYGIAAYDLDLGAVIKKKQTKDPDFQRRAKEVLGKIRKQVTKDYVAHPLLSLPTGSFLPTLAANFTANIVRNLWSNSVILCGHFPEGVETFEKRSIEGETKGEWYVRQMLGERQHLRLEGDARDDRQPEPPDRAPPVPGPAVQPVRRDRPQGARPVREVRPHLLHAADAAAGLLGLAQGRPALAAQRLARHDTKRNLPRQLKALYKMTTGSKRERRAIQVALTREARQKDQQLAA